MEAVPLLSKLCVWCRVCSVLPAVAADEGRDRASVLECLGFQHRQVRVCSHTYARGPEMLVQCLTLQKQSVLSTDLWAVTDNNENF